mmetsp:Transcript_24009/g.31918  ORF Transcript_24009/g.31918 Transcript_24009/m.31918 type:complete len:325 (+) Transcript_24009:127-1101(+)
MKITSALSYFLFAAATSSSVALTFTPTSSKLSPSSTAFSTTFRRQYAPSKTTMLRMSDDSTGEYDFDVIIIGCGVGGHGAALHSRAQSLKTAVFAGGDVGGTCVNRGCVPSKALLAASGRVRDMKDAAHLSDLGIAVEGDVTYDREGIAAHAKNLANRVKGNLENSLIALGVDVVEGRGVLTGNANEVKDEATGKVYTAKDIILAPGSIPFVPPGITVDEKTVFTSDGALELPYVPEWVAIIGSGYIGLEFSDVYTALGSEVTFIEALPMLMPTFDREIAKMAERMLIRDRPIDYRTNVFASEVTPGIPGEKPVTIKMIDANTK